MSTIESVPHPDEPCGEFFIYRDFFECSDTWQKTRIDNIPSELETYTAVRQLCREILDPVSEVFGRVYLTYGFSGMALSSAIRKNPYPNINPPGDQHAGSERNTKGDLICQRRGIAVDFYVGGVSSLDVARWIVQNSRYDRLYFYSRHRPFHVSIGPENSRSLVWMDGYRGGRHQPRMMKDRSFLESPYPFR